jgi:hypothetical protein
MFLYANANTRVHVFSDKNYYRSKHLQMPDYHPGKFEDDLLSMVAVLCQLQFVVFSFCRGEKTTKRQDNKTIIIVF